MKERYTLKLWRDDMGNFAQAGCTGIDDALWHVNRAREHDGLVPLSREDLVLMLRYPKNSDARATLTPEWNNV